jgi:hypothetical protein
MRRTTASIVAIALASMMGVAAASDWRQLGIAAPAQTSRGAKVTGIEEIDASSVVAVGGHVDAWLRDTYPEDVFDGPALPVYRYDLTLYRYDCADRHFLVLQVSCYDSSGQQVYTANNDALRTPGQAVVPDSIGEHAFNAACSIARSKK